MRSPRLNDKGGGKGLALPYNQRNRRNLTEAELLRCIEAVDQLKVQGEGQERVEGKFQPKGSSEPTGKSAEATAKIVGTSTRTVERARTALSDFDPLGHFFISALPV